jgi:hypothetical protein
VVHLIEAPQHVLCWLLTSSCLMFLLPSSCQGLSITGAAMATMELARVDASCATFYLVHTFLAMLTIALMVRGRRGLGSCASRGGGARTAC